MDDYEIDFNFEDFFVDLTEKNIFTIFGCKNLGLPLDLTGLNVFILFKSVNLGIPTNFTSEEISNLVLYLSRKEDNKTKVGFSDSILRKDEKSEKISLG